MDSSSIYLIPGGVGAIIGLAIHHRLQQKRNMKLAMLIKENLRMQDPLTLLELSTKLGMGSFTGRGKVAMALNELEVKGLVEIIPALEGTPQLQKVNHIRYRWCT